MAKTDPSPADYIEPLYINGLNGRMLHVPAPKAHPNREILIIYGHHSTLERWWGFAQCFNRYGAVTMPDLPGFGGMESMYKIGKNASLDNMADYLATFVKWRYKRKKVVIVGLSYGFLVATRMLQRYPELTKKVDFLVSAVGYAHYSDFVFSSQRMRWYRTASRIVSWAPLAWIFRYAALNPWVLRQAYAKTFNAKKKFAGADPELSKRLMDMEITLWHANDVRTHMATTHDMLTVDNCRQQVNLDLWHVASDGDQYFDNHIVEQHLHVIFKDVHVARNKALRHAPSVIADAAESFQMLPLAVRRALLAKR
ncbi:MAG TPA: alpha/beta fold hydrolase [Candidatus Saccharimonadales bacterium]|nr:alpha/beta fold hydrolase [Candidatus Saccharimonadales bacterium]